MHRVAGEVTNPRSARSLGPDRKQLEVPTDLLRVTIGPFLPGVVAPDPPIETPASTASTDPTVAMAKIRGNVLMCAPLGPTEWRSYGVPRKTLSPHGARCKTSGAYGLRDERRLRRPSAAARLGRSSTARRAAGPRSRAAALGRRSGAGLGRQRCRFGRKAIAGYRVRDVAGAIELVRRGVAVATL